MAAPPSSSGAAAAPPGATPGRAGRISGAPEVPFEARATRRTPLFADANAPAPVRQLSAGSIVTVKRATGPVGAWEGREGIRIEIRAGGTGALFALWPDFEALPGGTVLGAEAAGKALMHGAEPATRAACEPGTERIQLPEEGDAARWSQRYLVWSTSAEPGCAGWMAILAGAMGREVLAWTRRPGAIVEVRVHPPAGEPPLFEVTESVAASPARSGTRHVFLSGGRPQLRELLGVDTDVVEVEPARRVALKARIDVTAAPSGLAIAVHRLRNETRLPGGVPRGSTEFHELHRYEHGAIVPDARAAAAGSR